MFDTDPAGFDTDATLSDVVAARAVAEAAEVRVLCDAARWADLHCCLDDAVTGVSLPGTETLVALGGAGTPEVAEFAPAELGAVLGMSAGAAAVLVGDALDLRHRLPRLWARIQAGQVRAWVGRKCAQATRQLSVEVVAVVDRRVARWAHSVSWGRLQTLIDATVIEANPEAAAASVELAERSQGVWLGRSNDHGIKDIWIRTEAPAAIWFDASIDRAADILGQLGDTSSKDVRRGRAVAVLARPQQALDLFAHAQRTGTTADHGIAADTAGLPAQPGSRAGGGVDPWPPVTLYVHLSEDSLLHGGGVARFEGQGPVTVEQVRRWLGHCQVTVKPVIDLANQVPVDGYEVPDRLREAVQLRSPADVFPYATSLGRRKDVDHTVAYVDPGDGGPPGQTALDNLGPMIRRHHRIKTHSRWQVTQVSNGVFIWRSPHGRLFLVDHNGTRPLFDTEPEAA